jgi:hypothetical protein
VLYLVPMVLAPDGGTSDEGSARNRFLDGQRAFPRYSPWNVIPEVDQISVATSLLPWRDPYVDLAKAERVWSLVAPLYDEMEQDADFHSLGSVMGMGYRELVRMEFRTGHYFVLVSEAPGRGRLPCLIYLHGLGGNRKAHLWALSRIIRQTPCVLVAPTFGLGNWDKTGGAELVVDVAREVSATLPVDPDQFFLLGYSLGAKGVTRAVVQEPDLFRGLVYLSPVTDDIMEWMQGDE